MFIKLRNKFLVLCMTVTSLIMIVSFAVIYITTYNNIQNDNIKKLNELSSNTLFNSLFPFSDSFFNDIFSPFTIPSDYNLSFTLVVDEDGNYQQCHSYIDIPEEIYIEAAQIAWRKLNKNSPVKLNGRMWQYVVSSKGYFYISKHDGSIFETKEINGYLISFLDVTESHKTLKELLITFLIVGIFAFAAVFVVSLFFANHAIKPIKTAWEAQKQFIADASHELKTPLTIVSSNYGALISRKSETIESQIKWLDYIKEGTDRMTKLIGDLLTLARIEGMDIMPEKKMCNISVIISEAISEMEAKAIEKNIHVSNNTGLDITIKSVPEKIKQAFMILLDNAVKYTDENGKIEVSLTKTKRHIRCDVTNSGKGISPEDLPKIFDRFYRADTSRAGDTGSYGLGLAIAKTIIESMNGEIIASSIVGKSTTVSFILQR